MQVDTGLVNSRRKHLDDSPKICMSENKYMPLFPLRFILSGSGSYPTKWPTFDARGPAGKKMAWKFLLNAHTRI